MDRRKAMQRASWSVLGLTATSWAFRGVSRAFASVAGGITEASKAPAALRASASGLNSAAPATEGACASHPILYIQTVRYKPEVSSAQVDQLLTSLQETLSKISQIKSIRIGHVIDENPAYDYAVVMEFDTVDDLKSYASSPIHTNWVKEHNPVALSAGHSKLTLKMDPER